MPGPGSIACPKPTKRKTLKARRDRKEAAALVAVRKEVDARDGAGCCRLAFARALIGPCGGRITLAHLWEKRRFKTRGMAPEDRHDAAYAINACQLHHQGPKGYDAHGFDIEALSDRKAHGRLRVVRRLRLLYEDVQAEGSVIHVKAAPTDAYVDEPDS